MYYEHWTDKQKYFVVVFNLFDYRDIVSILENGGQGLTLPENSIPIGTLPWAILLKDKVITPVTKWGRDYKTVQNNTKLNALNVTDKTFDENKIK